MENSPANRAAGAEPSVVSAPPEQASLVEDFIDIFYAPSQVFARRATSGFWAHLLVVTIIAALFAFANRSVFEQIFDVEFQRGAAKAMADNPRITPDMMEGQRKISTSIAGFMQYVGAPLLIFVVAVLVWLIPKFLKIRITYQQAVLIMTLAFVPRLIQYLLTTVQMLFMDTAAITSMHTLSFSPARFMDPDSPNRVLLGLMGRLDLFTIWVTILIGIGIAVMGKAPKSKGLIAAAIIWLVATLPLLR
jgi:hypothetical protein